MNQKEINELRRRFRADKSSISRIYGCFVNTNKEIVAYMVEAKVINGRKYILIPADEGMEVNGVAVEIRES